MAPKPHDPGILTEALRRVAIAGVTLNAEREPNTIYHLLNNDLRPLCGTSDTVGPPVMAVQAPWILRCNGPGCSRYWPYISKINEVITTAAGDRFHYDVHCQAFRVGRLGSSHAGYRLHEVKQMTVYEAERLGKTECGTCGGTP